jgi:hypothetical protein
VNHPPSRQMKTSRGGIRICGARRALSIALKRAESQSTSAPEMKNIWSGWRAPAPVKDLGRTKSSPYSRPQGARKVSALWRASAYQPFELVFRGGRGTAWRTSAVEQHQGQNEGLHAAIEPEIMYTVYSLACSACQHPTASPSHLSRSQPGSPKRGQMNWIYHLACFSANLTTSP